MMLKSLLEVKGVEKKGRREMTESHFKYLRNNQKHAFKFQKA